jgi:hydrogenase-4 component F
MTAPILVLLLPVLAALVLVFIPYHRVAGWLNAGFSLATLLATLPLLAGGRSRVPEIFGYDLRLLLLIDDFNVYLLVLTAFVGFTTSVFSAGYIAHEVAIERLTSASLRFYHSAYQAFTWTLLLALMANNLGILWVAVEGATLATALMVGLYRTEAAIEAAWKYFILCGVGIALALFGTILIYLAAQPVVGGGLPAMAWTEILRRAAGFDPVLLNLAFVFLLVGYGTKVGLVPLQAWLPDAHAEGPTPISAVLSGLLLNVALYAVLRFKMLLAANGAAIAPGPLMISLGLASVLVAGLMLYRRRDIKRLFAYSSIEHMGIITFAFGMGGPLANFAALLHMTMHSLTKSAIFFAVGHISQVKHTQQIKSLTGLTSSHPWLGCGFVLAVVAIAGVPPLGIFTSEFLVMTTTIARQPVLAVVLAAGLLIAFGALVMRLSSVAFGTPTGSLEPVKAPMLPLYAHLGLVLVAGVYLPGPLVNWFNAVARLLG